ncbi:Aldo/keto reductase [Gammaproteobacteria bacterium]
MISEGTLVKRPIPRTGELLPVIGLGTYRTFDVGKTSPPSTLRTLLERFSSAGGKLIDTSPMYGNAENVVGALASEVLLSKKIFWATKIWSSRGGAGIRQMEDSLHCLQVFPLDLVQIHNLMEWQVHLPIIETWKTEGRIRYCGITHYHPGALSEVADVLRGHPVDFVQIPYNVANRAAEKEVLPLAQELGVAVIANLPLGHGALLRNVQGRRLPRLALDLGCRDWASFFLKFVLSHPAITCAIPATADITHLECDLSAGFEPFPDKNQREQIAAYVSRL